jgi:Ca2+-binding EF-hand superfamily protein
VDWAFKSIDIDKSGRVDKKELYSGLVLIHLKLAAYLGPAACRPATREYVEEIFEALDEDESGELDKEEFSKVITMLISQMTTRVILQLSMTLVIVPMIAGYVFNCICVGYKYVRHIISNMNQFDKISSKISIMMEENIYSRMPDAVVAASAIIQAKVGNILTKELMETLPITIIGVLLGMLLVPWAFLKCDAIIEKMNSIHREKKKT